MKLEQVWNFVKVVAAKNALRSESTATLTEAQVVSINGVLIIMAVATNFLRV